MVEASWRTRKEVLNIFRGTKAKLDRHEIAEFGRNPEPGARRMDFYVVWNSQALYDSLNATVHIYMTL